MRLEITGRHLVISPDLRASAERRLARLGRKLHDGLVSAQIVLTREQGRCHAEATVHVRRDRYLHGEGIHRGAAGALAVALERIEHQADTLKGKWSRRQRQDARVAEAPPTRRRLRAEPRIDGDAERVRIVRVRRHVLKPMSVEDAAIEVGTTESAFVVFRNAGTDAINVLFRRADGHLGLIEPDSRS